MITLLWSCGTEVVVAIVGIVVIVGTVVVVTTVC